MIREFRDSTPTEELEWHMDRRDRQVTVVEGAGWKLQLENGLPFPMIAGSTYTIPKESWHRLVKGHGNLKVLIRES